MRPASRTHEGMVGISCVCRARSLALAALLLLGPRAEDSSRVLTAVNVTGGSAERTREIERTSDCEGTSLHQISTHDAAAQAGTRDWP